jgi:hypothetical protein
MTYPFPPRYFIGYIDFVNGTRVEGEDTTFYPIDSHTILLCSYNSKHPLVGMMQFPKISAPVKEIQYSIACLDKGGYLIETLNHKFKKQVYLRQHGSLYSHTQVLICSSKLLTTIRMKDLFRDVSRDRYPVTQFIA